MDAVRALTPGVGGADIQRHKERLVFCIQYSILGERSSERLNSESKRVGCLGKTGRVRGRKRADVQARVSHDRAKREIGKGRAVLRNRA